MPGKTLSNNLRQDSRQNQINDAEIGSDENRNDDNNQGRIPNLLFARPSYFIKLCAYFTDKALDPLHNFGPLFIKQK